jgi:hypothetical protein
VIQEDAKTGIIPELRPSLNNATISRTAKQYCMVLGAISLHLAASHF